LQKNIRNVSETEQELDIILTVEEYGPEIEQELEEARRNLRVKGFRPGHAPVGLVKKLAGPGIEATVAEKMASKYFSSIAEEEKINPAGRASIESFDYENGVLTVRMSYEIHPEFELKEFGGYSFTQANYSLTDADMDREINLILKGHGTLVTTDEAAGSDDTLIADVVKLDEEGQPVEEEKTENHHFNLSYLPEDNPFRQSLTGKKAGETVDVVPTPRDAEDKPASFRVTVKEVKRMELPELNDELVKEITQQRFETVADFRADVRQQLEAHFNHKSEEDLLEAISAKFIEENPVPTPRAMVDSFENMLLENAKRQVGGKLPKGLDEREFRTALRPNAEKHARWLLISQKIAKLNDLKVNDEDIRAYAEKEAENNATLKVDELVNTYMSSEFKDYIVDTIMKDKIYEIIKSQVSIVKEDKPLPTQEED
jgi:trigger factor